VRCSRPSLAGWNASSPLKAQPGVASRHTPSRLMAKVAAAVGTYDQTERIPAGFSRSSGVRLPLAGQITAARGEPQRRTFRTRQLKFDQSSRPPVGHCNPGAINPSAAASQRLPTIAPRPSPLYPRPPRLRVAPIQREFEPEEDPRKRRSARAPAAYEAHSCKAGKVRVGNWQALREHLATCWHVPDGTEGSSVTLRFGINGNGELRGPPLVTGTDVKPKASAAQFRKAAAAVLEQCLPVCPIDEFGATMGESTMHLRLVNDTPFPSRNLGPWMAIFSQPRTVQ